MTAGTVLRLAFILVFLACGLAIPGCRLIRRAASLHPAVILYKTLFVTYDLDARQRNFPLGNDGVMPASYQSGATPALPHGHWARARLSLAYPHPEGLPDMVRATLRLSSQGSASRVRPAEVGLPTARRDDEIWVLDLSKAEVDKLVTELTQGAPMSEGLPTKGANLEVKTDQGLLVQRAWPAPMLEDLMLRVYHEGRLSGFAECPRGTPRP